LTIAKTPTILIIHLKRMLMEKKIQKHPAFDTTLDIDPYMAQGKDKSPMAHLTGFITNHGQSGSGQDKEEGNMDSLQ